MTLEHRTSTLLKFFFAAFFSWSLFYQLHSCQTLRLTLCLCVPNSKSCPPAERRERLAGTDSSPWSPDPSSSSRISVWPRIPNMYTENEHTRGRLESQRWGKKKNYWQWRHHWRSTIPPFHPPQMKIASAYSICSCVTCSSVYAAVVLYVRHT